MPFIFAMSVRRCNCCRRTCSNLPCRSSATASFSSCDFTSIARISTTSASIVSNAGSSSCILVRRRLHSCVSLRVCAFTSIIRRPRHSSISFLFSSRGAYLLLTCSTSISFSFCSRCFSISSNLSKSSFLSFTNLMAVALCSSTASLRRALYSALRLSSLAFISASFTLIAMAAASAATSYALLVCCFPTNLAAFANFLSTSSIASTPLLLLLTHDKFVAAPSSIIMPF